MGLTSEQARYAATQPKITPVEEDQLISLLADGKRPAELAIQFGKAVGTIYNFQTRKKERIAELRRKRSVEFEDLFVVRKQARLDDLQNQRNTADRLIREHLASCFATNPVTGQREFVERLVDARKLKVYVDMLDKAVKMVMVETGQQVQMPEQYTRQVLGLNGNGGVDYGAIAQAVVQRKAEWEAEAPQREAAKREREARRADDKAERADHEALLKAVTARRLELQMRSAGLESQYANRYEAEKLWTAPATGRDRCWGWLLAASLQAPRTNPRRRRTRPGSAIDCDFTSMTARTPSAGTTSEVAKCARGRSRRPTRFRQPP
jgi:hypothetical protein